ncbi:MAG: TonB-dependent receptor plug domain-containing protein, partial [Deltaproteobacteria bacterium]|nr:TonB-dependent receptor plug domain-containing protein [Deltaproteobacteria bacterium]
MPATPSRFARVTLALLFLWIGALVPVHARADEAPSDDDDSAQEDEGTAEEGEGTDHTDHDHDAPHVRESITVTAQRPSDTDTHARVEIEAAALERTRGQDLAEAIGQVDGVTVARGAADSSKPIIRGQTERRLLVLSNGVRHASQKWGADHATEIDPFAAGRLSVVKGAAGVKYGPDAIGGVILVDPPRLLTTPGVDGVVQFIGVSNGLRFTGAGRLDLAPAKLPGFVARIEGNYSRGSSLRAPTYVLGNTASQVWNVGATLHYHRGPVHLTATYEHYDLRAGVFYGMSSSTPDAFAASLERDAPLGSEAWTVTPVIDRPMQTVQHDRAVARAEFFGPRGTVHVTYAFQLNRRKEFEPVRSSVE